MGGDLTTRPADSTSSIIRYIRQAGAGQISADTMARSNCPCRDIKVQLAPCSYETDNDVYGSERETKICIQ